MYVFFLSAGNILWVFKWGFFNRWKWEEQIAGVAEALEQVNLN